MTKLENDYERMIPEYHHGMLMYGEHIMRYESVLGLVKDKVVLDIASGSGYGSASLAKVAKKVYGVDINEKAIAYSKEHYRQSNISFKAGSGTDMPIEDDSIDVVVSHETIEHIDDYKQFLKEVKRVLKADGQAIISTPNDDEYPAGNHFHLHQFKIDEFKKLLGRYFSNVTLYYQGAWVAAALLDEKDFTSEWRNQIDTFKTQAEPAKKSTYVVAVCSDVKAGALKSLAALTESWSDKTLRELAAERESRLQQLNDDHDKVVQEGRDKIQELEEELRQIKTSKSWRYTRILRQIKDSVKGNSRSSRQ